MSNENRYTSRFIQKHDVEANWDKAVGFYPLQGEMIVYDPDENYNYPRFKFGIWDGTGTPTENMLVSKLPFSNGALLDEEAQNYLLTWDNEHKKIIKSPISFTENGQAIANRDEWETTNELREDEYATIAMVRGIIGDLIAGVGDEEEY